MLRLLGPSVPFRTICQLGKHWLKDTSLLRYSPLFRTRGPLPHVFQFPPLFHSKWVHGWFLTYTRLEDFLRIPFFFHLPSKPLFLATSISSWLLRLCKPISFPFFVLPHLVDRVFEFQLWTLLLGSWLFCSLYASSQLGHSRLIIFTKRKWFLFIVH